MSDSCAANDICVHLCGRPWRLVRTHELESLWNSMGEDDLNEDERLPYWTELWPASIALCSWLFEQRSTIAGRVCLDLGCGLGLTALVARWLGAKVMAFDYEFEALHYARINAGHNGISQPLWLAMDWRMPALARHSADCLWGGDIMYESRFAAPVLDFIEYALAPGGRAWVAEPCRNVYDVFRSALHARGWAGRCVYEQKVEALYAQAVPVTVRVWELMREAV